MTDTLTKGSVYKNDLAIWDGGNSTTGNRKTSTGGVQALDKFDWVGVDVYQTQGSKNHTALNNAISAIGTTRKAKLFLSPGTWEIDEDVNLTNYENIIVKIAPGATLSRNTGDETITFYSPENIECGKRQQITSVDMIAFANAGKVYPQWWGIDAVADDVQIGYAFGSLPTYGTVVFMPGSYKIDTSLDLSSYTSIFLQFIPGATLAQVTGDETITFYSPENIIATSRQTITEVDMIAFSIGGTVYPQWFNTDPYTNGFQAIRSAMRAAILSGEKGHSRVHIPAGNYTISTTSPFSDINATEKIGILVTGDGWQTTRLILSPSGSNLYFYNNVSTARLQRVVFENIGFFGYSGNVANYTYANISQYTKGFRFYSAGHEQSFKFRNCHFSMLDTVFEFAGTSNSAENHFSDCTITHIRSTVINLNNDQAVNHEFYGTDVESIYGNVIDINGGGSVKVYGGSWIMVPDDGPNTDKYLLKLTDGTGTAQTTTPFIFNGTKFELRGEHSKLVDGDNTDGMLFVVFNSCNIVNTATAAKNLITLEFGKRVDFNECVFHRSGTHETFTLSSSIGIPFPGTVKFINCYTDPELADNIVFDDKYGYAHASGCILKGSATTGDPRSYAQDFDMTAGLPSVYMPEQNSTTILKYASLLYSQYFPYNNTYETTVKLPPNALIKSIKVFKPASGGSTSDYCLHVGNSDKSTVYVSSIPEDQQYSHKIDYERGSKTIAQLTTRTDADTGVFSLWGGNSSISEADTVNVNWVVAGTPGRRLGMTVSSILMTTQGVITISLDGGAGDNLPAANSDVSLSSVSGFIDVGATDNERIVRLWSSDGDKSTAGGDSAHNEGYAIIEYY